MMTMEALLTNPDPVALPRPLVKWSYEPPRPQDVPAALARASTSRNSRRSGPCSCRSRWTTGRRRPTRSRRARSPDGRRAGRAAPDPDALRDLARRLAGATNPVLVAGPTSTPPGALGRRRRAGRAVPAAGVGAARLGRRAGRVPRGPSQLPGRAAAGDRRCGRRWSRTTWCWWSGAPVFTYYPYIPGPVLPEGTSLVLVTNDPQEAARAPVGDAIVADVALTLEALLEHAETPDRAPPEARPAPEPPPGVESDSRCGRRWRRSATCFPPTGIVVERVTLEHARLAQSGAPVAPVQLLLLRRRRARLRAAGRGRHAARAARPAGGRA